jgi:hypothetical protein
MYNFVTLLIIILIAFLLNEFIRKKRFFLNRETENLFIYFLFC